MALSADWGRKTPTKRSTLFRVAATLLRATLVPSFLSSQARGRRRDNTRLIATADMFRDSRFQMSLHSARAASSLRHRCGRLASSCRVHRR